MSTSNYNFGGVRGPVQTGGGVQYTAGRDQHVVHGNQYVAGRDQVIGGGAADGVLAEVARLRQALDELRLTAAERQAADRELGAAEEQLRREHPDRQAVATHLGGFVEGLKQAGALAAAGTSLVESIRKVATWLGPAAAAALPFL